MSVIETIVMIALAVLIFAVAFFAIVVAIDFIKDWRKHE